MTGLSGAEKDLGTVRVGAGSRLEGMLVREVPWPDGVRVLTIERAGGRDRAHGGRPASPPVTSCFSS